MPAPPPDGGWGWVVVAGSFLAHFIILGTQYSSGILLVAFLREWPEADASSAAWVASAPVAMMLLMSRIAGPATARIGHRAVCIIGAVLGAAGLALTAATTSLWQAALTMGIIAGAGMSFGFVPAVLIVPLWFKKRRALALGLAVAGSGVGTFAVAPGIEGLIAAVGWRAALLWLALAMGGCLLVAASLFTPPKEPAAAAVPGDVEATAALRSKSATPTDADGAEGKLPSDASTPSTGRLAAADAEADGKATPEGATTTPGEASPAADVSRPTAWQLTTLPAFLPLLAATVVATGGYNGVFAHLVNSSVEAGVPPADAALTVSVLGALSTVGRIVAGRVSDARVVPPHLMWYGSLVVAGAATMLVPLLETTAGGRIAYGAVFGLCAGNFIALMPVATADAVGVEMLPLGMGVMYSVQTLPVLAGPPAAGAIQVAAGAYWPAWLFMGGVMLAGGLLFLVHPREAAADGRGEAGAEDGKGVAPALRDGAGPGGAAAGPKAASPAGLESELAPVRRQGGVSV